MTTLGSDFIGTGWKFPIKVDARGRLTWSQGTDRLQDAIWLIVKTSLGERVMRPTFGAGVDDYVFQPNSPSIRTALATGIRSALTQWEPRVDLDTVSVDPVADEPSQVLVTIAYRVRTTNELFNIVYPFYLEEGVG
jgi:phage baseplate assembly protein W